MTEHAINLQHYADLTRAAWLDRRAAGYLRLSGADRIDFLQRMTTNNMARLQPGEAAVTVLTSPTARIVSVFTVLCRADDLLLLPAGTDMVAPLARHLRGQIFFMDKVTVHTEEEFLRARVVGAEAASRLSAWHAPIAELANNTSVELAGGHVLRQDDLDLPGFEILVPAPAWEELQAALTSAEIASVPAAEAYTARRVELGRPAYPAEFNDDYSPLEVSLAWTCAENKGCYTGQEIIARQITYDKVTRTLVGVQAATEFAAGATVTVDGKQAGTITTATYSPQADAWLGLAVVRRPHNVPGQSVELASEQAPAIAAQVVDLPLTAAQPAHIAEKNHTS